MSTFAPNGSTDDIPFKAEKEFLHKSFLGVVKCAHQRGFLQELIDFHQMLADNKYISNIQYVELQSAKCNGSKHLWFYTGY